MNIDYTQVRNPSFAIRQDELAEAIIELNSMSLCDGIFMMRDGRVRVAYRHEEQILCELISAPLLARQLTADGLSSYTGKELRTWAESYEREPLQERVDAAMQAWLDGARTPGELLSFIRSYPHGERVSVAEDGALSVEEGEGEELPEGLLQLLKLCRA